MRVKTEYVGEKVVTPAPFPLFLPARATLPILSSYKHRKLREV